MNIENGVQALESAVIKLVKDKPFFANLILNMKREFTTDIPTVGVNVTEQVNLFINPYFFSSLALTERTEILCHEVLHVLNNHFVRFKEMEPTIFEQFEKKDYKTPGDMVVDKLKATGRYRILNMAADYAINEHLPNLPKKFKFFDKEGNMIKGEDGKPLEGEPCLVSNHKDWERQKHMEYYYDLMKQQQQKQKKQKRQSEAGGGQGESGEGDGDSDLGETPMDDHGLWGQGNQDAEYVLEKIKNVVNKAVEASGGIGNVPSNVNTLIDRLNYKPRDWKQDLQRFVARTAEILIESSRKIRNRRYGILYPGTKTFPKLHLAFCVDTSGSMSDESLSQIAAELDRISQNNVEITVIEADCTIQSVWKFDPKKLSSFKGRGGTAYQPAIDYAEKELDVDGIIYAGDMDASDRPKKPRIPLLWAIVGNQRPPVPWGSVTHIKIEKKNR